jgi:hypothetical protein
VYADNVAICDYRKVETQPQGLGLLLQRVYDRQAPRTTLAFFDLGGPLAEHPDRTRPIGRASPFHDNYARVFFGTSRAMMFQFTEDPGSGEHMSLFIDFDNEGSATKSLH